MFDKIVIPQTAFAAGNAASLCVDASLPKAAITAHNGKWIEP